MKLTPSLIRPVLFIIIFAELGMVGVELVSYPRFFSFPGALASATEPTVLLLVLLVVIHRITTTTLLNESALVRATLLGLIGGSIEILHIILEHLDPFNPQITIVVTVMVMLLLFTSWALAGYGTAREDRVVKNILAGSWSAMTCMLLVVLFGFSQFFWFLPELMKHNIGSPDLIRSGWTDLHAFTIADLFQSGLKVLLIGPIVGGFMGMIGGVIELSLRRRSES